MYNSFIHEQRVARFRELEQSRLKETNWHKRYHTEVQPFLLEHYEKRISSFIHHVGEKPILMNPERVQKLQEKRKTLVFRNGEDWRSYYDIRERKEIKDHQKFISSKDMKQTGKLLPSFHQSPQREFRSRSKELEINPPMRYTSQKPQSVNELIEINRRKPNLKELIKAQRAKDKERNKTQPIHSSFITTHHSSATTKHHEEDEGDFLKHDKTQNIEVEARIYEKQRQIVEKKLHFKKLLDLAVKNPNQSNRREYKSILERCGLLRGRRGHLRSETTELDKFTTMVQTADKQRQTK